MPSALALKARVRIAAKTAARLILFIFFMAFSFVLAGSACRFLFLTTPCEAKTLMGILWNCECGSDYQEEAYARQTKSKKFASSGQLRKRLTTLNRFLR